MKLLGAGEKSGSTWVTGYLKVIGIQMRCPCRYLGTSIKNYDTEYYGFENLTEGSRGQVYYRKAPSSEPQGPGQSETAEENPQLRDFS